MASLNRVQLIGHLGRDPETRYMPNGEAVTNVSIATSEQWKDAHDQRQERTEWHRLTFYRRLAEVAGEYLKKGAQIYVEGKLTTRKWTDKEGKDRYTTEVICDRMLMLGGGKREESGGEDRDPPETAPRQQTNRSPTARPAQQPLPGAMQEMDDDIPF